MSEKLQITKHSDLMAIASEVTKLVEDLDSDQRDIVLRVTKNIFDRDETSSSLPGGAKYGILDCEHASDEFFIIDCSEIRR